MTESNEIPLDARLIMQAIKAAGNAARLATLCGLRNKNAPNIWKQQTLRGVKLSPMKRATLERVIADAERPLGRRPLLIWSRDQRVAFGQRLRVVREGSGLRSDTFAYQLGIPPDLLKAFEDGTVEAPVGFLVRVVQLVPEADLFSLLDLPRKYGEQRVHGERRLLPLTPVREKRESVRRFVDVVKCSQTAKHLSDQLHKYTTMLRDELMIRDKTFDPRVVLAGEVDQPVAPSLIEEDHPLVVEERPVVSEAGTVDGPPADW